MVFSKDLEESGDQPVTKCVLLISPTVNWKLSDAYTAENLLGMGKKKQNWSRYDSSSLTASKAVYPGDVLYLTNLPGDLVNLNHLLNLSRHLVSAGVVFKQQIYLDDVVDPGSVYHMYKSMEDHLEQCLGPVEDFFKDDYFLASISNL